MSATSAPGVASPVVSPSSRSLSIAQVRVLGAGSVRQDFGHSLTPAQEAVFVACVDADGDAVACVLDGPQLRGELSVHGADNAILLVGWFGGTMTLGDQEVTSPRGRASMFLAKLVRR